MAIGAISIRLYKPKDICLILMVTCWSERDLQIGSTDFNATWTKWLRVQQSFWKLNDLKVIWSEPWLRIWRIKYNIIKESTLQRLSKNITIPSDTTAKMFDAH